MLTKLHIKVRVKRVPLSRAGAQALKRLDSYDLIVFSSKHAQRFFMQLLRERNMKLPRRSRVLRVGPRADLLKHQVAGKRVLYPRSALAPFDIIRRLRAGGATVVPLVLYTAVAEPLSSAQRRMLAQGKVSSLHFRSPSGVRGLLRQLSPAERRIAQGLPAWCIGATTLAAARSAGFGRATVMRL